MSVSSSNKLSLVVFVLLYLSISTCSFGYFDHQQAVALFVFGDSLFDPGNNNYINTSIGFQVNFWPYGQSYFTTPTGRYNDGRIIPDFIAEYAKLPLIPAYLEPGNHEFMHGANFASGGAGALAESHAGLVVDLQTQIQYFGDLENRYRQILGDDKAQQLISNAVYLLSFGSNDYINLIDLSTYEQYVDMGIGNLTNAIKEIYEKGGRKFGIVTVPHIGCWPAIRIGQPGNTCHKELDDIIKLHNQALSRKLETLEKELEGFMYAKFDISTSLSDRMKNPSKFGFKDGETACCGSGPLRGIESCGGMRGIKEYELCENPSEYLYFDCYHPNELASRQFAELFWSGDTKVTEPYNLKTLFEGKPSTISLPNEEL